MVDGRYLKKNQSRHFPATKQAIAMKFVTMMLSGHSETT